MDTILFWERIKTQLKLHKVSQSRFADYVDIPLNTLRGWMYHKRIPDLDSALTMASALGVSIEYLAYGNEHEIIEEEKERRCAAREAAARMLNEIELVRSYF